MASRKQLGALYVSMGANTTDFRSKMAGARMDINKTKKSFSAMKAAAIGALGALTGGVAIRAVRALNQQTKELAEYGAQIDRRAKALNVSTEELQYHQRALDALGGGEEVFTKGIEKSTKAFYDYAAGLSTIKDAFRVLGVTQEDVAKVTGSTTAQFELLLEKIAELQKKDQSAALAASLNVFGARTARDITPFAAGYQSELRRARRQGDAINDADVKSLADLNHELDVFNQKMKNLKAQFVADNADEILEVQEQWHEAMVKLFPLLRDVASETAKWASALGEGYAEGARRERRRAIVEEAGGAVAFTKSLPKYSGVENYLPFVGDIIDTQIERQIGPALSKLNTRQFEEMLEKFVVDSGLMVKPGAKPEGQYQWTLGDNFEGMALTPDSKQAIKEWEASVKEFTGALPNLKERFMRVDRLARLDVYNPPKVKGQEAGTGINLGDTINKDTLNAALANQRAALRGDILGIYAGIANIQQGNELTKSRRLELEGAGAGDIAAARTGEQLNQIFEKALDPLRKQRDKLSVRHETLLEVGDVEGATKAGEDLDKVKERIAAIRAEWQAVKMEIFPGIIQGSRMAAEEQKAMLDQLEAQEEAMAARTQLVADLSAQLASSTGIFFDKLTGQIESAEEAMKSLGRTIVQTLHQRLLADPLAKGIEGFINAGISGVQGYFGGGTPGGFSPGADALRAARAAPQGNTQIIFNGVSGPGVRQALNAEVPGIVRAATDHIQDLSQNPSTAFARTTRRR